MGGCEKVGMGKEGERKGKRDWMRRVRGVDGIWDLGEGNPTCLTEKRGMGNII